MSATNGLVIQFVLLMMIAGIWMYFKALNAVQEYRAKTAPVAEPSKAAPSRVAVAAAPPESAPSQKAMPEPISPETFPGAGKALAKPPEDLRYTLAHINHYYTHRKYTFPIGWIRTSKGVPDCSVGHFQDDVYHVLITAQTRSGKDNLALNMFFALAARYTPEQVQMCVLDGKGLDFSTWEGKAHTWRLALKPEDIQDTMHALTSERLRRGEILRRAQVSKWENYQGSEIPLLVVYISELSLLEDAVGKTGLTSWLNSELAAGAAFGIRYIVATQTASNFATRWRSQISLYLAGFQPSASQDQPNTGLLTSELKAMHVVPPSELPPPPAGAGIFTAVQGNMGMNVRVSYLSDEQRAKLLRAMPDRIRNDLHSFDDDIIADAPVASSVAPATNLDQGATDMLLHLLQTGQPLPLSDEACSTRVAAEKAVLQDFEVLQKDAPTPTKRHISSVVAPPVVAPDEVPIEEQERILAAAQNATSRSKLCQDLYEVRGGQKYVWVQKVCDAAGILAPQSVAA